MAVMFDYHSSRARKARLSQRLAKAIKPVCIGAGIASVIFGSMLLVADVPFGWALVGLCGLFFAVYTWYDQDLRDIAAIEGTSVDLYMESAVLARLPEHPSPQDLAIAAISSASGQFSALRFGVAASFLRDLSSSNPEDTEAVLRGADDLRQWLKQEKLTGAMLVATLCVTQPQLRSMLPHLQLNETDLAVGAGWYARIMALLEQYKQPKRTGGIARDWNFGYSNMLSRYGVNITNQVSHSGMIHAHLESHASALQYIYDTFGSNGRQNVALIGPVGVGKTAIVYAFAESLLAADSSLPSSLKFRQVVSLDASSIIGSVGSRGELENLINHILVEAFYAKNIIICLDEAQAFFEDAPGAIDISSILMPILEGGRLRMILTMDEQRYLQIAQRNPSLASALNRVNIAPASEHETIQVMQDKLIDIEFERHVSFMYQSLKEAYRLSERYFHELAQPGKSVRLLEQAAGFAENGLVTARSIAQAVEVSRGVKVGAVETNDEREKLLQLEDKIHERMINQSRAVKVVCDALRRARAGVRNEAKPIGTFLFLGPTGVGKTELAKSLAAVYFGGEGQLVRLDMNEFIRPEDISRLIADGADDPYSLTAQIMKQPFSVVLLDEIEKAHPQVMLTMLQMLDEGILRDVKGREVSFRDAIVIATSNAGAERIRVLIDEGHQLEEFEDQITNELIDSQQFRPEFLNRFDEIVVFRPLTQQELGEVVKLMIKGVNRTLEPQQITVELDEAAIGKLAAIGYDPRLGARPMRRVVQRFVQDFVTQKIFSREVLPGGTIRITEADVITGKEAS